MAPSERNTSREQVTQFLAESLGQEQASQLVDEAARGLNLPVGGWTREQAVAVLDQLTQKSGTVGIIARFVKARAILQLPRST